MLRRAPLLLAALLAAAGTAPAAAQTWGASYYPYVLKGPNEKTSLILHYQYSRPAEYEDRVPSVGSLSLEAGINADGGRFLTSRFKGPLLSDGWRFYGEAGSVREARHGYFGLGNRTMPTEDPADPEWDRVNRTSHYGRAEVSRRIAGRLMVSAAGGVTDATYRALPGPSSYLADCDPRLLALRAFDPGCGGATDWRGRLSLVLDLRDDEFVTARGAFFEGGVLAGTGGAGRDGYQGIYGIAQGYASPRPGTVIAARVLARHLTKEATLEARSTLEAWERSIPLVGGPASHRGVVAGRWTGRDVLLANLELRHDILNLGDYGAITAVGFLDGGRAVEFDPAESKDLHWGGGAGIALRLLRVTILTFNWGWSADGYQFAMGTGWMF